MSLPADYLLPHPRLDWHDHIPFAGDYDDIYWSRSAADADPRAEKHHVFIDGNDLPQRFAAMPADSASRFVAVELGCGFGINLALVAETFQRHAPAAARLEYYSIELHPLHPTDLQHMADRLRWPLLQRLHAVWPPPVSGLHRRQLNGRCALTLGFGAASDLLPDLQLRADAWLLDGFDPRRNPAMWCIEVFKTMATLSRPGAGVATYSAAGQVRRDLAAVGFMPTRRRGFAGKREHLTARYPGNWIPDRRKRRHIAIAGAGLAGATLAAALAERDQQVTVLDPAGIAARTSAMPLLTAFPRPSRIPDTLSLLALQAFWHLVHRLRDAGIEPQGVLQLRQDKRFHDLARQFADIGRHVHFHDTTSTLAAAPPAADPALHAMQWHDGVAVDGPTYCTALLTDSHVRPDGADLQTLATTPDHACRDDRLEIPLLGGATLHADRLVLCTGAHACPLTAPLQLHRTPGYQLVIDTPPASIRTHLLQAPVLSGPLTVALDTRGRLCVGSTYRIDDPQTAHADLLTRLRDWFPDLPADCCGRLCHGVRSVARDRTPVVGPLPDFRATSDAQHCRRPPPIFVNLGYASNGLLTSRLLADVLAAELCDDPLPLTRSLRNRLLPARFMTHD